MEDEASVRQASRQFLIRSGHTVLEATHGEDAIRASHEPRGPIHLLVTDLVMPRMGGPTLAERLTDERPDLKVLFVSGDAENTVLKHGTIGVATRFLQKPFSLKTLETSARFSRRVRHLRWLHLLAVREGLVKSETQIGVARASTPAPTLAN